MKWLKFSFLVIVFTIFNACNGISEEGEKGTGNQSSRILPDSNGGILDIIVVAEENVWDGLAGELVRKYFTQMQYGLPQPEPRFTVNQVTPKQYNSLLKRTRYQILLSLGDSAMAIKTNQHAKNQVLAYFTAPTQVKLAKMVAAAQADLREKILAKDRQRILKRIKPTLDYNTSEVLKENNIRLGIPQGFELEVEEEKTLVFWRKTAIEDIGLIIHFRPMPSQQGVMGESIVPVRDSLTKVHILGEREGSYMITENLLKPQLKALEIEGQFAMEARGLWRTEGDILGGPFLSYTIYNEQYGQIIYLDTFIFSPNQKKRNMLFEMEAVLRSVEIL